MELEDGPPGGRASGRRGGGDGDGEARYGDVANTMAQTAARQGGGVDRCRRFRGSGRTLELPLVRSAAMVTAPVELRRGTGTSPTRWPKPQHGKGTLGLESAA